MACLLSPASADSTLKLDQQREVRVALFPLNNSRARPIWPHTSSGYPFEERPPIA
jgi:hypothetical protein